MQPMIDPKRDLVGATPAKLARALLRPLRGPRAARQAVVGDEDRASTALTGRTTNSDTSLGAIGRRPDSD